MSHLLTLPVLSALPTAVLAVPLRPGRRLLGGLADRARRWPTESQAGARRNAMIACTALAARRAEREDVEEFLRAVAGSPAAAAHG